MNTFQQRFISVALYLLPQHCFFSLKQREIALFYHMYSSCEQIDTGCFYGISLGIPLTIQVYKNELHSVIQHGTNKSTENPLLFFYVRLSLHQSVCQAAIHPANHLLLSTWDRSQQRMCVVGAKHRFMKFLHCSGSRFPHEESGGPSVRLLGTRIMATDGPQQESHSKNILLHVAVTSHRQGRVCRVVGWCVICCPFVPPPVCESSCVS